MPVPQIDIPIKEVVLITSGDLRLSANQVCWPAQEDLERKLTQCFSNEGVAVKRAFPVDAKTKHGFISSQRMGMEIQWPMVNVTFDGVSRDSFMARHRANHVSIAYAPDVKAAAEALAVKSAMFHELGIKVHLCGPVNFD